MQQIKNFILFPELYRKASIYYFFGECDKRRLYCKLEKNKNLFLFIASLLDNNRKKVLLLSLDHDKVGIF